MMYELIQAKASMQHYRMSSNPIKRIQYVIMMKKLINTTCTPLLENKTISIGFLKDCCPYLVMIDNKYECNTYPNEMIFFAFDKPKSKNYTKIIVDYFDSTMNIQRFQDNVSMSFLVSDSDIKDDSDIDENLRYVILKLKNDIVTSLSEYLRM